jgi:hypothetical protein
MLLGFLFHNTENMLLYLLKLIPEAQSTKAINQQKKNIYKQRISQERETKLLLLEAILTLASCIYPFPQ